MVSRADVGRPEKFSLDTFVERRRARFRDAAKFGLSERRVAGEADRARPIANNHGSPHHRALLRLSGGSETRV